MTWEGTYIESPGKILQFLKSMHFVYGVAVVLILILVVLLICFYYYHLICFCLPRYRNKQGCFIDLENSIYVPLMFSCFGSCYWICLFNRDINISKIVYLYDGRKTKYTPQGEVTPLLKPNDSPNLTKSHDTCPICLDHFLPNCDLVELSCDHYYHVKCIRKWISDKCVSKCPLCNHVVYSETIIIEDSPHERRRVGRRIYMHRPPQVSAV